MSGARAVERSGTPATSERRPWTRDRVETVALGAARRVVIGIFVLAAAVPFYYMALLSVRTIQEVVLHPGSLWVPPGQIGLSAYRQVLKAVGSGGQGFVQFMLNSAFVAVLTVAATLLVAIPGAYAVARLAFKGRRQAEFLFLAVYFFPTLVIAIPLFVVFTRLGLRGSLVGLVFVYIAQTVPVAIYMLRNYFETIPQSLEEAALLDGCSRLQVIRRVSLPLAAPSIMATALYVFMIAWNEFLFALLFLIERRDHWTVSLGLSQLAGSIEIPTTVLMAGSVVLTVPIILLFFAAERLLVEGLTSGAEKG